MLCGLFELFEVVVVVVVVVVVSFGLGGSAVAIIRNDG